MTLSSLVAYRNLLQNLPVEDHNQRVLQSYRQFFSVLEQTQFESDKKSEIMLTESGIQSWTDNFHALIKKHLAEVNQEIQNRSHEYLTNSYNLYETMRRDTAEYILQRQSPIDKTVHHDLVQAIRVSSDWKFPALFLRPGTHEFIDDVVGSDPVYLGDTNHDLLLPALDRYNELFRSRLRTFVINEDHDNLLSPVPDSQMGTIVVLDFFEYKPMELLRKYINECFTKLRPGGVFIFTFNNCDTEHGVMMCEKFYRCFTPLNLVTQALENTGFAVTKQVDHDGTISWVQATKPGTLRSLRGGQSIAAIRPK